MERHFPDPPIYATTSQQLGNNEELGYLGAVQSPTTRMGLIYHHVSFRVYEISTSLSMICALAIRLDEIGDSGFSGFNLAFVQ